MSQIHIPMSHHISVPIERSESQNYSTILCKFLGFITKSQSYWLVPIVLGKCGDDKPLIITVMMLTYSILCTNPLCIMNIKRNEWP
jgi:hypothetical protein